MTLFDHDDAGSIAKVDRIYYSQRKEGIHLIVIWISPPYHMFFSFCQPATAVSTQTIFKSS